MTFERYKKRLRSDRSGVSEVVGNILILMITVILFSAIVAYVNQIPVPEMTTKADFAATVSFETAGNTTATLTVTHAGGVVLEAVDTAILLHIDATTQFYNLSGDSDFPYSRWSTGMDWTKAFTVPSQGSEITVTVIDMSKHSSIWTSQVSGGAGGNAPIVLQRYVDSNTTSPTPDAIKGGDDFSFYVKVIDLDNDLDTSTSGVYLDSSDIEGCSENDTYEALTSDGWFRFDFVDVTTPVTEADGKILKVHAWDEAGHETVSSYEISVTILPTNTIYYPADETPVEYTDGLPPYISYTSGGQGYGLYGENTTSGRADTSDDRNNFTKDEKVFIRVASTYLKNLMGSNAITVIDTRTGFAYVPTFVNRSTVAAPFYSYTVSGTANIYECQFNTSGLPPSAYTLEIDLKSTGDTTWVYRVDAPLVVEEEGSSISFVPRIWTFKDTDDMGDYEWGDTKTTPFVVYSSDTSVVYVSVKVQDASVAVSPSVDDVRIVDMRGDTELHGTPPSGSMLTEWTAETIPIDNQTYQFRIGLRLNNGDQWLGGTHAYALKISRFADENEGVYSLSKMIFIRASTNKADFFIGAAGFMTGTSNFVDPQYLYYVQNNNFFTKRTIYDYANAPSAADNYAVSALALGDLDGDGDKDILMGQYGSHNLYLIENSMNTYGVWQEASEITRPSTDSLTADINWIAMGDINGDGDTDFAYSTSYYSSAGRTVVIYNNTYGASGVLWNQYGTANSGVRKVALEDMTGDGRADLIVLANGYVYVYDLLDWDPTTPLAQVPAGAASSNILDFDIADVNCDGMLDVVTVDDSASGTHTGIYVNYYVNSTSPVLKKLTGVTAYPEDGEVVYGLITDTQSYLGNALVLSENATGEDIGKLSLILQTETLTSELDQEMIVRAKVSSGAIEGFYIWYSSNGVTYTPMIYIPPTATSYENYSVRLPPTVAGGTIYIKITDTLSTESSASTVEELYLDYFAVQTNNFGGYTEMISVAPRSERFICVRTANLNGITDDADLGLEIIGAKDAGLWRAYNRTSIGTWSALAGWTDTSSTFYCKGDGEIEMHSSMQADSGPVTAILTNSAPRLFWVVDVNGDGFDDVVVTNSTINEDITSQVALYVNMYPSDLYWSYYVVKDIAAEYNTEDVRGGFTSLIVTSVLTS